MTDQLFIKNFAANQHRIHSFILALSPNWTEAEEVFQRTSIVLWTKWDNYDRERDFLAWALGIARLEVLKHMSQKKRSREVLSTEAMDAIEARSIEASDSIGERMNALKDCLDKLPSNKRALVDRCYGGKEKIIDVAAALGVTADALYWRIKRIREMLHNCIDRKLTAEE